MLIADKVQSERKGENEKEKEKILRVRKQNGKNFKLREWESFECMHKLATVH